MKELRVAVVGAGHLGMIHAKLLNQVQGARLVAIADPSPQRRELCNQQFKVPTFASHQELIGHADAVVVAAPTFLHYEIARDLLYANIDLLVEKPLTNSAETARQLVQLARSRRRVLQVGHIERFNPAWVETVSKLGAIKYVEAVRASSFPGRCLDGGVVLDLMIHDLDLVLSLSDAPIVSVAASGMAVLTEHEDIAETRLTFADGLVANLKASRISPTAARRMQVYGSQGFAELDFGKPSATYVRPNDQILSREFNLDDAGPLDHFKSELFERWLKVESLPLQPRNAILDELHDFVVSVACGSQPVVSGEAGARAVEVADKILSAIQHRNWLAPSIAEQTGAIGPFAMPATTPPQRKSAA